MELYIKNMVCNRCILVVKQELQKIGLEPLQVSLGTVTLKEKPTDEQLTTFKEQIVTVGFELLDDKKKKLIEQIKTAIIKKVQKEIEEHFSISEYITTTIHKDYAATSRLFSEVEAMTIEQFFILQKIEKVKELLTYNELTLSEISYQLGYNNVGHLSTQFKKITGLTPTNFKMNHPNHRKPIDGLHHGKV
ncbi:MAG TPA: AraC family transcriptional regulator [Ferruginibacter sp.]|nr:AraC family transcriptional regulator [Ferruginibacter sp.]